MLQKAEHGDPVAQIEVGKAYYFYSDYTESNRLNTFDWISRSANRGNLEAQFKLGDLYALGWETKQCRTSAYEWYTKAAVQGYKKALIRIHNLYQEDVRMHCRGQLNSGEKHWEKDREFRNANSVREQSEYRVKKFKLILNGAMDYYTGQLKKHKTSNQEDPDIQQYLGFLFQHGYGTKKYISVAINYYTKAAEQGLPDSQFNLGFLYQKNTKIKFNYRKAFHWYKLAAEGGNVAAQNGLAYFYEKGLVNDVDYLKALHWYTEAANAGHSGAQITLGKWYRKGQCVEQDYTQTAEWYKLAASQGSQVAQNCLDLLYQNGNLAKEIVPEYSTEPSRESRLCSKLRLDIDLLDNDGINTEQIKKIALNASKGDGNTMYEIGLNYYNGTDFTQDKDNSFKWLRLAANTGHKEAQFKLAEMYKEGDVVEQDYHKRSI
jgi:TPR repeat protein